MATKKLFFANGLNLLFGLYLVVVSTLFSVSFDLQELSGVWLPFLVTPVIVIISGLLTVSVSVSGGVKLWRKSRSLTISHFVFSLISLLFAISSAVLLFVLRQFLSVDVCECNAVRTEPVLALVLSSAIVATVTAGLQGVLILCEFVGWNNTLSQWTMRKTGGVVDPLPSPYVEKCNEILGCAATKEVSCNGITHFVIQKMEEAFYSLGFWIGGNPWKMILSSSLLCLIMSCGMFLWYQVNEYTMLWIPYGSEFKSNIQWIRANFPPDSRYETLIVAGENVLTPQYIQYLSGFHDTLQKIEGNDTGRSYPDLCYEYSKNSCAYKNILRLWDANSTIIASLTEDEILTKVTEAYHDESLDAREEIKTLLSGVTFDSAGNVRGAKALMSLWLLKFSPTAIIAETPRDLTAEDWELGFIDLALNGLSLPRKKPDGAEVYLQSERSYDDAINDALSSNFSIFIIGFVLLFLYLTIAIGRFNLLEQRIVLALCGIGTIGMALASSFGISFYMQQFFGDMHPTIPFLLLGLGVDDMFIIVQALENLSESDRAKALPERIGLAMRHAGISVTVTSVTDLAAFIISASTRMPFLRSFCIFAAMGILFLYIYAITFFVGCLALDEVRIESRKTSCCSTPRPVDWKPNDFSQKNWGKLIFGKFAKFIFKAPIQFLVYVLTVVNLGFGVYGTFQVPLNFDVVWYFNNNSYQTNFFRAIDKHYPDYGERVEFFTGKIDYWKHIDELLAIQPALENIQYIRNDSVDFWFPKFHQEFCTGNRTEEIRVTFGETEIVLDPQDLELNCSVEPDFKRALLLFLNENEAWFTDMKFNISFGEAAPLDLWHGYFQILSTRGKFQHGMLDNTTMKNIALQEVKTALKTIQFEDENFPHPIAYAFFYVTWEANQIIAEELIRNLSLTFVVIMLLNLMLIANIQICLIVLTTVVLSLVDLCGCIYYMGLSIEITSSLLLILSIGLLLDYSAHIAVAFVTEKKGSKKDRAQNCLVNMGLPVFNGAFSTFLTFCFFSGSNSYVFLTFFKCFSLVTVFGLFHGLFLLPLLLSHFGPGLPKEQSIKEQSDQKSEETEPRKEVEA